MQQFAGSCDGYRQQQFSRCRPKCLSSWAFRPSVFKVKIVSYLWIQERFWKGKLPPCSRTHTHTHVQHTRAHVAFWVLLLLMGSKGTSFSWCGVIEAAVLKGCAPLLLLRHKVMQTPSQLLTQEVSMLRCPLMREADSYLIFVFQFRCCPFDPSPHPQWRYPALSGPISAPMRNVLSKYSQTLRSWCTSLETGKGKVPHRTPAIFCAVLPISNAVPVFRDSKYLKVKGHERGL